MKKIIASLLSLALIASAVSCSNNKPDNLSSSESCQDIDYIKLENKMTEKELARADKHDLTLLDEPVEPVHKVCIEFKTDTAEDKLERLKENSDKLTDEQYENAVEAINKMAEAGEVDTYPLYATIDGYYYSGIFWTPENDISGMSLSYSKYNQATKTEEIKTGDFDSFENYLDWFKDYLKNDDFYDYYMIKSILRQAELIRDALKSGDYEILPEGSIDPASYRDPYADPFADYRDKWEYDKEAVEAIKDSIDEINIYDEELNMEFLVHVTLPPNYDENKTYPVFFLTDGVWRFGNHTELRKVMEDGEADDVILVSLGYNYKTDGTNPYYRFTHLIQERDKLLDFVTDNLMPYLGENYNIDYINSTLYGHSNGGVFTHNALFKSDTYDNQPFGNYIIGSPAFWGLYDEYFDLDPDGCQDDYGYFDRNESLNKKVFLCGGSLEDPDYSSSYNGHDTTLEGLEKLNKRLESHNADVTYKLYESHHYQFIPEMLIEVLKNTYPAK